MAEANVKAQRMGAVILLLIAGILSLPLAAAFLDGQDTENWILPAQLVGMAVFGAIIGRMLPGLAGEGATTGKATMVGAVVGIAFAVIGYLVFWVLLTG